MAVALAGQLDIFCTGRKAVALAGQVFFWLDGCCSGRKAFALAGQLESYCTDRKAVALAGQLLL